MNKIIRYSLCGLFLMTAGCSEVKSELGLDRHTPDEFAVMQRAPLDIPADLNTLPAPQLGAPRPQDVTAKEQAKMAILGEDQADKKTEQAVAPSAVENALINKVGAQTKDSKIREQLAADKNKLSKDNRPVVKRLLGLSSETANSSVVDAAAEAKRIKDAKAAGKPITDGETPSVEQ